MLSIVVATPVWYYRPVRRLVFFMLVVVLLSACGRKAARVLVPSAPGAAAPSSASVSEGDSEDGLASFYAEPYHGRRTANGEVFDTYKAMTAAHKTLPFNTLVRVTNKQNGESVEVRINDRGPFVSGRIIDLSLVAARKIEMVRAGVVPVKLKILKEGNGARVRVNAPTPSVLPASASAAQSVFSVQVGAFENLKSAEDLKNRLARKFPAVSIQTFASDTTIYRVRVGSEPDMESAQKLASQLRKQDLNVFVVRVER